MARRMLLAAAGSAVALGSACPAAMAASADAFDGRHLSANQGAGCASHTLALVGDHVLHHGRLPKVFNHYRGGGLPVDGVAALCEAVDEKEAKDGRQGPLGLLGGLPLHGNPLNAVHQLPVGASPLGHTG
ncbi:exported protein of unknown function [Streptantibioticus cattleyicolor NRRL 8057 = DSM 46488]|nr:hypothetical protein [Streptomyces sp. SID5468]CCB74322.1 exported protein of unknown function [Streptantibioticus cattleyicolor NRRL 8057 = DSM 46488]